MASKKEKSVQSVHDAIRRGSLKDVQKNMKKLGKTDLSCTNTSKQTPLHTAAIEGQLAILLYLLEKKKADVNAKDRDDWTPLHCACHSGHLDVVDQLLTHGAAVNVATSNGTTPLHYFVRMQEQSTRPELYLRLFRVFLRKGVDINSKNQQGETPLHMASFRGKERSVGLLLSNNADANVINKYGETCVHLATRAGHLNILKLLVEKGAKTNISGTNGTPLEIAARSQNKSIISYLESLLTPQELAEYRAAHTSSSTPVASPASSLTSDSKAAMLATILADPESPGNITAQSSPSLSSMNNGPNASSVPKGQTTGTEANNVPAVPKSGGGNGGTIGNGNPSQFPPYPGGVGGQFNQIPGSMPILYGVGATDFSNFSNIGGMPPNFGMNPGGPPVLFPGGFNSFLGTPTNTGSIGSGGMGGTQIQVGKSESMNSGGSGSFIVSNWTNTHGNQPQQPQQPQQQQQQPQSQPNLSDNSFLRGTIPVNYVPSGQSFNNVNPAGSNAFLSPSPSTPVITQNQPGNNATASPMTQSPQNTGSPSGTSPAGRRLSQSVDERKSGDSTLEKSTLKRPGSRRTRPNSSLRKSTPDKGSARSPGKLSETPKQLDNYMVGETIGKGAFGAVFKGMDVNTGIFVAIKQVTLAGVPPKELKAITAELSLLKRLENEHIVKFFGYVQDETNMYFIMEFVEGGSLQTIIKKFGRVGEPLCARYVSQTLLGLDYLHRRGVIHRDIKCGNILITKDGVVKLADFGIAAGPEGHENSQATLKTIRDGNFKNQSHDKDAVGSPYWMAPEVILLQGASTNSDIWSLGCTVIELITGNPPYSELSPMSALYAMVQDEHPPIPDDISTELKDFLRSCFRKEAEERPSARELLKHPFLVNHVGDLSSQLRPYEEATPEPTPQPPPPEPEPAAQPGLEFPTLTGVTLSNIIPTPEIQKLQQNASASASKQETSHSLPSSASDEIDDSEDDETDEVSEESPCGTGALPDTDEEEDAELIKVLRQIRELMGWLKASLQQNGRPQRAVRMRGALRKDIKVLRNNHREHPEAREVHKEARELIRLCESTFPDNIPLDESDTDYDSQDSFFGEDDDLSFEEEDDDFKFA